MSRLFLTYIFAFLLISYRIQRGDSDIQESQVLSVGSRWPKWYQVC